MHCKSLTAYQRCASCSIQDLLPTLLFLRLPLCCFCDPLCCFCGPLCWNVFPFCWFGDPFCCFWSTKWECLFQNVMCSPECWFSVWVESTNLVTENIRINNSCQFQKNQQIVSNEIQDQGSRCMLSSGPWWTVVIYPLIYIYQDVFQSTLHV